MNLLVKHGVLENRAEAIGLSYKDPPVSYNLASIKGANASHKIALDKRNTVKILNHWKAKQLTNKPKAIFLCVSGGGQRSALWSMITMSALDSVLNGHLMDQTVLITGASGGMVGAAY